MSKRPNIAERPCAKAASAAARAPAAASKPRTTCPACSTRRETDTAPARRTAQPSRAGTKAITGHYPPAVRYQLKLLAAEQGRTMEDMLAEGLNLLFAAYNKPEIAPTIRAGTASKN
jgi:hypothetical protein